MNLNTEGTVYIHVIERAIIYELMRYQPVNSVHACAGQKVKGYNYIDHMTGILCTIIEKSIALNNWIYRTVL